MGVCGGLWGLKKEEDTLNVMMMLSCYTCLGIKEAQMQQNVFTSTDVLYMIEGRESNIFQM